jgi:hypothetical protein
MRTTTRRSANSRSSSATCDGCDGGARNGTTDPIIRSLSVESRKKRKDKNKMPAHLRPMAELIRTAKALDVKIKQCTEKTEQLQMTLGLTLKEAKARKPANITWPAFVSRHFNFSRSRADTLIQIADGRTTVAEVREGRRESVNRSRNNNPPLRSGGSRNSSSRHIEPRNNACDVVPINTPRHLPAVDQHRFNFRYFAAEAIDYASRARLEIRNTEVNKEVLRIAREASRVWSDLVVELERQQQRERQHDNTTTQEVA